MAYEDEENEESGGDRESDGGSESGNQKEDNSISTAEKILLNCVTVPADLFELVVIFAGWIPIIGWGSAGLYILLGALSSSTIFIWSIFRGTGKDAKLAKTLVRRIIIVGAGAFLGEFIPFLRTISINVAIYLHNKAAKGDGVVAKVLEHV